MARFRAHNHSRALLAVAAVSAVALAASACAPKANTTASTSGTASASCSASTLSLYKQGQLTVATDSPAYSPWFDNNNPGDGKGFESAVAYAVAQELGFAQSQVKWVVEPFDNSYAPGARTSTSTSTRSRSPRARARRWTSPPATTPPTRACCLNSSKYADATSLAELKGAKIGVQVGTTSYQAVEDEIKPTRTPSVYNTTNDEVNALKNGQVDAIVTDMPTVFYLASAELSQGEDRR